MIEDEIVAQLVTELNSATGPNVDVRTAGGDQNVEPPEVILRWDSSRVANMPGHRPVAAHTETGYESHLYFNMDVDCLVRDYDESAVYETLNDLHLYFVPFEREASNFDEDTYEWEVGTSSPRDNPVVEPDWYEVGFIVEFGFVKKTNEGEDTIDSAGDEIEITKQL
jgi:hypothetical protein